MSEELTKCPHCHVDDYWVKSAANISSREGYWGLHVREMAHCNNCGKDFLILIDIEGTTAQIKVKPKEGDEMSEKDNREKMDRKNPCANCGHVCEGRAYVGDTAYGNIIDDSDCDYEDEDGCNEENGFKGWIPREETRE